VERQHLCGVLDAQNELAAVMTRKRPREQRGARAADVQVAGGGGAKRVRIMARPGGKRGHFTRLGLTVCV